MNDLEECYEGVCTNSLILFGAGGYGAHALDLYKDKYEIICYVDSEKIKHVETEICELRVYSPEKLRQLEFDFIMICCGTSSYHIKNLLHDEYGVPYSKIITSFIDATDFAREAALYQSSKMIYEKNLHGSVAEVGVFEGKFAKVINRIFYDRKIYLFDTFQVSTLEI